MRNDPVLTHETRLELRHPELVRQAYLLTGDRDRAVRLAERALGAAPAGRREGPADAEELARMELVRAFVAEPGRPAVPDHLDLPGWQALGRLSARRRAAIVLRFDEGLDEEQAAARMGTSAQTVRADVDAALLTLRTATRGADDPWALVITALSTAGDGWYTAAGLPPAPRPPRRTAAAPEQRAPGADAAAGGPGGSLGSWASTRQSGSFGSFGRPGEDRAPAPVQSAGHPVAGDAGAVEPGRSGRSRAGDRRDTELLSTGPAASGPARRFLTWPVAAAAVLTAVVVLGAVNLLPALRVGDDGSRALAPVSSDAADTGAAAAVPPKRTVAQGLLDWPARGPDAGDTTVLARAGSVWRAAVGGAEAPATDLGILYAGEVDGTRTVVAQALDGSGRPVLAQLSGPSMTALTLRKAAPLPPGTAVLSLLPAQGPSGPVRVLVSPEAQVANGLLTADPMSGSPLRRMPVDAGGVSGVLPSPPGDPTCSRVVVVGLRTLQGRASSGPRVLQSGIVRADLLTPMSEPVEVGSARLAPADGATPEMTWFGDGKTLAKKVSGSGTLTVAALGPPVADRRISAGDRRTISSRAYELRRGNRTWVGSVVRIDGETVCASATPAPTPGPPTAFVLRCPMLGGTAGLLHVVGTSEVTRVDIALAATPAPAGQRPYTGQVGPPSGLASTNSFAALQIVPSGFPCGAGSVRVSTGAGDPATATLPLYTP